MALIDEQTCIGCTLCIQACPVDAIVGAVHEIGQRVGVATPAIGALLGLVRLMARTRGLY